MPTIALRASASAPCASLALRLVEARAQDLHRLVLVLVLAALVLHG